MHVSLMQIQHVQILLLKKHVNVYQKMGNNKGYNTYLFIMCHWCTFEAHSLHFMTLHLNLH